MKNIILILSVFTVTILGAYFYHLYIKKNDSYIIPDWYSTKKSFDIVSGSGKLISINNISRGILVLSPNYQERNRDFTLSIYDPRSDTERTVTIFKDIPEGTNIELLQNTINPDRIWVTSFHKTRDCKNSACDFKISEFDLNSQELISKHIITITSPESSKDSPYEIVPLLHDPVLNKVWFAYNSFVPRFKHSYFDIIKNKYVTVEKEALITSVVSYDVNTNTNTFGLSLLRSINFNNRHSYDVDKNGDLYLGTECIFIECPNLGAENLINPDYQIIKVSADKMKLNIDPIFLYGMKQFSQEFTVDQDNASMYIANMTWNNSPGSIIVHYDTNRKISTQVGTPPIEYEDDIRGILSIQNKLLIGTFKGLGIYNKQKDTWKMVTSDNGIRDNNVETIVRFANGICLRHETNGSSCYYGSLDNL